MHSFLPACFSGDGCVIYWSAHCENRPFFFPTNKCEVLFPFLGVCVFLAEWTAKPDGIRESLFYYFYLDLENQSRALRWYSSSFVVYPHFPLNIRWWPKQYLNCLTKNWNRLILPWTAQDQRYLHNMQCFIFYSFVFDYVCNILVSNKNVIYHVQNALETFFCFRYCLGYYMTSSAYLKFAP